MINGATNVYAVIGHPVEHSVSPMIHNALFQYYQMDAIYVPYAIAPADLADCFSAFEKLGVKGYNITIPHKKAIAALVGAHIDPYAKHVGAVNTVAIKDGKSFGYNTDGYGFLRAANESGCDVNGKNVVFIGGGGAAQSVAVKLAMEGASKITVLTRRQVQGNAICDLVNSIKNIAQTDAIANVGNYLGDCDILINATPVGMFPHTKNSPIEDFAGIRKGTYVFDLIYNPFQTRFLKLAKQAGCRTQNGLDMLIYQGFQSFFIWTGVFPDENITSVVKQKTCEVLGIET